MFGAVTLDSYAFLPRAFRTMFEAAPQFEHEPIWADFTKPLNQARIGLLSSAGIFIQGEQDGFDVERERQEPTWGDPTLRPIRSNVCQADIDVALPINRLGELVADGRVGSAAPEHFSVMGFQQDGAEVWRTTTGPEIAARCHAAEIDALILAPA